MKKYIVTGGAGFVGSTLADRLIEEGNEVIIIDNLHTGSKENVHPDAKFIESDVLDIDFNDEIFEDVDGIYHLGISSSSPMYKKDPSLVGKIINEHINVLEKAKSKKIPVVFASTSSVYSGQEPHHHEKMEVLVTDYYTEGRYGMERISELYANQHGVNVIGLRLFSVYGKKEKAKKTYANLISQFMWDLQDGKKPVVYGDGNQTRDFTYADDIVEAFVLAMKHLEGKNGFSDFINAGTGKSYTINEMIDILNKKLGTTIEKEHVIPNPIKCYVMHTLADTKKAKETIGFTAKHSLEDGIDELIKESKKQTQ
ncbi:MAG: NAD-dependent epimerase/dehydratase family protein [Candidatus Aenigmarchaeota archaeon]|nr:NAD-dependent epimerase/dehydratase family protein [Candidatus Aenigmarchaeota archaeon]